VPYPKDGHVFLLKYLTAVAPWAARKTKQFTDSWSNYQPLNSPGNKVNTAAQKQPSNSAEKVPSTSHKQPYCYAVKRELKANFDNFLY